MDILEPGTRCPIDFTLQIMGDRWTLLLMRDLLLVGKQRYGEFLESPEGISTNILANRLKQLEAHGMIDRFPAEGGGRNARYVATEKGLSVLPLMLEIIRWGLQQDALSCVPEVVSTALADNEAALIYAVNARVRDARASLIAAH